MTEMKKTAILGIRIRGWIRGIFPKCPRITDFRMAPESGHFAGFSGRGKENPGPYRAYFGGGEGAIQGQFWG